MNCTIDFLTYSIKRSKKNIPFSDDGGNSTVGWLSLSKVAPNGVKPLSFVSELILIIVCGGVSLSAFAKIENGIKNGCIIPLHDYNKLRTPKSQTIEALDIIIPDLLQKGYKFVTISELIDHLEVNTNN